MTDRRTEHLIVAIVITAVLAFFAFATVCACSDGNADEPSEIIGIYARDLDIDYDGRAHSIVVENTEYGDVVYYRDSASSPWSETAPAFVMPGEYTVYFRVERVGCNAYEGQASIIIRKCVLDGISAEPIKRIYDGQNHTVRLLGVEDGDDVTYSVDGEVFTDEFFVNEVGEYRVYYCVDRGYGEFRGETSVTVLPNIGGKYVNADSGIISLDGFVATVKGNVCELDYGTDCCGTIGEIAFALDDGILNYDGKDYVLLSASDSVYKIEVSGIIKYVIGGESITVAVEFTDSGAIVKADGIKIAEVGGVNYCESIPQTDYGTTDVCTVTENKSIGVVLSSREIQQIGSAYKFYEYDGESHGGDIVYDGKVLYKVGDTYTEEEPTFSEVGRYETEVVYIKNGYLPEVTTAVVEIVENICGVYFDAHTVIEITRDRTIVNGDEKRREFSDGEWKIDGDGVRVADGKLVYKQSGREFDLSLDAQITAISFFGVWFVFENGESELYVEKTDGGLVIVTDKSGNELARGMTDREISVTVNGAELYDFEVEGGHRYIIGSSDMVERVNYIRISES